MLKTKQYRCIYNNYTSLLYVDDTYTNDKHADDHSVEVNCNNSFHENNIGSNTSRGRITPMGDVTSGGYMSSYNESFYKRCV
jgi:hypothetical protein